MSITHRLEEGFNLGNEGKMIVLKKDGFTLEFNKENKTKSGYTANFHVLFYYVFFGKRRSCKRKEHVSTN